MVTRLSIVSLIALLAVAVVAVAVAQSDSTANVEVRIWQSTEDAENLYISARPEGGRWDTLGTRSLDLSNVNSRGTFRYSDITVAVPLLSHDGSTFTPVYGTGTHNDVHYLAEDSGYAIVLVYDDQHERTGQGWRFFLVCEETEYRHVGIIAYREDYIQGQVGQFLDVTYQLDDGPLVQSGWRQSNYRQLSSAFVPDGLSEAQQIKLWLPNTVRTFDISGLYDTVIQGNIENCGQY